MALKDKKGIPLVAPFILHARELLDARQQVDSLAERDSLVTDNAVTAGLRVFVKETKLSYIWDGDNWVTYAHPVGDGNLHVPANGTTNNGKILTAGANPGEIYWSSLTDLTVNIMKGATPTKDGESGTVPAPMAGQHNFYLRGDGTWTSLDELLKDIPVMSPATDEEDGTPGLVPGPPKGNDGNYIFTSNGTWVSVNTFINTIETFIPATKTTDGTPGLVPAPNKGDDGTSILTSNGTWTTINVLSEMVTHPRLVGATPTSSGKEGIVPAPVQGDQLSFLRGDGTWAIPTDTKYNVFTPATNIANGTPGLVPAPSIRDDGNNVLRSDGTWVSVEELVQTLSFSDMVGATVTTDGQSGFVPAPKAGEQDKLLRGDGTWVSAAEVSVNPMTGATDSVNGVAGIVPAPMAGEEGYFLRGDGTWVPVVGGSGDIRIFAGATLNANGTTGLVPAPKISEIDHFLKGDGTWASLDELIQTLPIFAPPTVEGEPGTSGLVPAPYAFDGGYNILKSDGTWSTIDEMPLIVGMVSNKRPGLIPSPGIDDDGTNLYMSDGTYKSLDYLNMVGATETTDGRSGTVPAPLKGEHTFYLRGDGVWAPVNTLTSNLDVMIGATISNDGTSGLVPAPTNNDFEKFLRGDGTWVVPHDTTYNIFDTKTDGLVPKSMEINELKYLRTDGKWSVPQDTTYKLFDENTDGIVPKTGEVDLEKYLRSDGSWEVPTNNTYDIFDTETDGLVPKSVEIDEFHYLRSDGTWAKPHDTTYENVKGPIDTSDGVAGLVPAPSVGDENKILRGDGTWTNEFDGNYIFSQGITCHTTGSVGEGYFKIAQISITAANKDSQIAFEIVKRHSGILPSTIVVQFVTSTSSDPDLYQFVYHGSNFNAYIIKVGAGLWDLYIQKSEFYDQACIVNFLNNHSGCSPAVEWKDETVATLPSGGTFATFYLPASSSITDDHGLNINDTYIKNIAVNNNGTTITFTKGNDTTVNINTAAIIVSRTAPTGDSNRLWIDTYNGGVAKYWNGSSWVHVKAVWG